MKKEKPVVPSPSLPLDVIRHRIILRVAGAFILVLIMIWMNSLLDLQYLFFGVIPRKWKWPENVIETFLIIILALVVFESINRLLKRLRYLRGFLPVCASCKKIRVGENWIPIDSYIQNHTELQFSHSMCPHCVEEYYPDLVKK